MSWAEDSPEFLLQCFNAAADFATAKTPKAALGQQMNFALCIRDWALANCSGDLPLLELKLTKDDDGHITLGPIG